MQVIFDAHDIRPLFSEAIEAAIARVYADARQFPDEVYSEPEAARLLKVAPHVLRDERLRGRINASLVGKRIRYTRQDIVEYLAARRWAPKP